MILWIIIALLFVFLIFASAAVATSRKTVGPATIGCTIGQCATNLISGQKRCPVGNTTIQAVAEFEVCNAQFSCDNNLTPFALLSDNSTNSEGICEPNVARRCLTQPQCSRHSAVTYRPSGGNPFVNAQDSQLVFQQYEASQHEVGDFCTIPYFYLQRTIPGCPFLSDDVTSFAACAGSTINGGCLTGQLASIPPDPDNFEIDNIPQLPIGCVNGQKCPAGEVPVWNNKVNQIICFTPG